METIILFAAAAFGAAIGSFLNVCIFRLPRRCLRLWRPQLSFCPRCHRGLKWFENIPLFAYVFLGGRCRGCRAPIPLRYFLVELGTCLLFVAIARRHLLQGAPPTANDLAAAIVGAGVVSCLVVATIVDFEHRIIPDEVDLPGIFLGPLLALAFPALMNDAFFPAPNLAGGAAFLAGSLESSLAWWGLGDGPAAAVAAPLRSIAGIQAAAPAAYPYVRAVFASLLGAGLGAGTIALIGAVGTRVFKRDAMGFGDVKLMGMIGAFVGWQGVLATIFVGSISGALSGIALKTADGRPTVTGRDLAETSLLGYLALRLWGAPKEAPDDQELRLRWGAALIARFATGDSYLAFGPYLALGGLAVLVWPEELWTAYLWLLR